MADTFEDLPSDVRDTVRNLSPERNPPLNTMGDVRLRHTRHYADLRDSLADTEWEVVCTYANSEYGLDFDWLATVGVTYREQYVPV